MKTCGLLILCGIPGSGKTAIAQMLCQNISSDRQNKQTVNTPLGSPSAIHCIPVNLMKNDFVHICYDTILPTDVESSLIGETLSISMPESPTVSQWKLYRGNIVRCVDWLLRLLIDSSQWHIDDIDPAIFDSFKSSLQLTETNELNINTNNVVLMIDDNMYYRSMRYEYYQLARKYQIGFAQLHVDCSLDTALARNRERSNPVPEDVIITMKSKLESPNDGNSWEKFTLICNTSKPSLNLDKIHELVMACLDNPVQPLVEKDLSDLEEARVTCSTNVIHQSDQILRQLVSDCMSRAKSSGEGKDLKNMARDVNRKRTCILERMKKGQTLVPTSLEFQNAAKDPDSTLYRIVKELFEEYPS